MLTPQEKNDLREMICSQGKMGQQGMVPIQVTPEILATYATKSDDDIKNELVVFKAQKKIQLNKQYIQLVNKSDQIKAQLDAMNG